MKQNFNPGLTLIDLSGSGRRKKSLLLVGLPGVDSQVKGVGIFGVRKLKLNP